MENTWNNKVLSDVLGADSGTALRVKQVALVVLGVLTLAVAGFAIFTSLLTLATMRVPQLVVKRLWVRVCIISTINRFY